jgi:hypothetical protein
MFTLLQMAGQVHTKVVLQHWMPHSDPRQSMAFLHTDTVIVQQFDTQQLLGRSNSVKANPKVTQLTYPVQLNETPSLALLDVYQGDHYPTVYKNMWVAWALVTFISLQQSHSYLQPCNRKQKTLYSVGVYTACATQPRASKQVDTTTLFDS